MGPPTKFESTSTPTPESVREVISLSQLSDEVRDLEFDADGNLWVATPAGVYQCKVVEGLCDRYTVQDGLTDDDVTAIAVAPDHSLWFGTSWGLSHFDGENWTTFTATDGLAGNVIFDLDFASDGNLWVATNSGVSRFTGSQWITFTRLDGLVDDYVYSVVESEDGILWFGTSRGVAWFDGSVWSAYTRDHGLAAMDVLSIAVAPDGAMWFGTLFGGASRFDGTEWLNYTSSYGLANDVVQAITLDAEGVLWFATREGISGFDGRGWGTFTIEDGLVSNDINAIEIAPDGILWIGTSSGISLLTPSIERFEEVGTPLPLRPTPVPEAASIPRFETGESVVISSIHMLNEQRGWALGGKTPRGDHVLRTADGGITWLDVTPPEPAPVDDQSEKMAFGFFLDEETAWIGYHSALDYPLNDTLEENIEFYTWRTQDGGGSWEPSGSVWVEFVGSNYVRPYMQFVDAQSGWVLARRGGVGMHKYPVYLMSTEDGGAHWERLIDAYEGDLFSCWKTGMSFTNTRTGWVTIGSCPLTEAVVQMSVDGGSQWEMVYLPPPAEQPDLYDISACDSHSPILFSASHGVLAVSCMSWSDDTESENHFMYVTEDGGQTWRASRYPGGELMFLNSDVGWALSRDLYESQDGGRNWTKIKTVNWDGQFSFVTDQLGWAVARNDEEIALVWTQDGGQKWMEIKPKIAP